MAREPLAAHVAQPHHVSDPALISPRKHRRRHHTPRSSLVRTLCLLVLLFTTFLGGWTASTRAALAASAGKPPVIAAHMTYQQFLQEGRHSSSPFVFPKPQAPKLAAGEHLTDYSKLPPSAEPPTMQPIQQVLSPSFLAGGAGSQPLDLLGSDHRLEVQIQPGSFDLSQATAKGLPLPAGVSLTLSISEVHGSFVGQVPMLGQYTFQVSDAQGTPVQGIRLRQPLTLLYHYDPAVLANLELDPGQLFFTWPGLISAARAAHQSVSSFIIPLANDPKTFTLSGQSAVFTNGVLDGPTGNPSNQAPPKPLVASVQGNSGQLAYAYPLTVAPGPLGTVPQLMLTYSSEATNDRHSRTSPAGDFGDGWSLSLGAITASEYPSSSAGGAQTWYSISGVDNINDLLVPKPGSNPVTYLTEHISYLRIVQGSANGQPCFDVWDTAGTFYTFGCTSDSLQYYTDSSGTRHNYRWDLNSVIPANEGPGTDGRRITITYEQDKTTSNGYTTIRDAVIKQIQYGDGSTIAGTIDFSYQGPYSDPPWVTAYTGSCAPLRCDDPVNYSGGLPAPQVMATFTPLTVTSYVGSDSSSANKDYSYSFSFGGSGYSQCWDDYSGLPEYCAGEHLLESVTPTVYQNGTGHTLPGLLLTYSASLQDQYYDSTQLTQQNPPQPYHIQTYWQYLASYDDLATGIGATVGWQTAYNNSHGTPNAPNGDDRHDPFYCSLYTDCTGNHAWPEDRAWSVQAVTALFALGTDSSSSSLQRATTSYHYQLAITGSYSGSGTFCYPAGSDTDCVGDNWIPAVNPSGQDNDWLDYYHSEFRGFAAVEITSPAGDLTVQHYPSTDGWDTYESYPHNYQAGSLFDQEIYQGNSPSGPLLVETQNTYAGAPGTAGSCNGTYSGVYTPCEIILLTSRTTQYEGTSNSNAPWVETDNTYDDYSSTNGLGTGYHNLLQQVITSSNAATSPPNIATRLPIPP